jgi:putative transposase
MKTIYRSYKYAINPSKEQQILLSKHFGCVRYVFNYFLNQRKEQFLATGKSDNYHAQALQLAEIKKQEERIWLKESEPPIRFKVLKHCLR